MTNLIGINSYIGGGKDTVGKIIQDLTAKFDDRSDMGSGQVRTDTWEIRKFATKLKQIASILTGIPVEKFEDQEFKRTFMPDEWGTTTRSVMDASPVHVKKMTVRGFLQYLGTEAIRDNIHQDAWVIAAFAEYKRMGTIKAPNWTAHLEYAPGFDDNNEDFFNYPKWVFTDCRFPNEAQAIKNRGGKVIRIDRDIHMNIVIDGRMTYVRKKHNPIDMHESETALDNWNFDYRIDNNLWMDNLVNEVRKMLIEFEILSQ